MSYIGLLPMAFASLKNRAGTVLLTLLAIAMSALLFLGVDKIRTGTRASFDATISGTDLVVGARSAPVNLMLATVFRIGNTPANISWETAETVRNRPDVAWTVPLSLGDSHLGRRVLGTTKDYFGLYKYGNRRSLEIAEGKIFEDLFDVVLGSETADALGYGLGDRLALTHGLGQAGISDHDDTPFVVVGILAPTGTPVDKTLHVSLEAIEAIHAPGGHDHGGHDHSGEAEHSEDSDHHEDENEHDAHGHDEHEDEAHDHDEHSDGDHHEGEAHDHDDHDENDGTAHEGDNHDHNAHDHEGEGHTEDEAHATDTLDLTPRTVSGLLVGLENRASILRTKRALDTYRGEALLAIQPGAAMRELWAITGGVESALLAISVFVIVVGLVSALVSLLSGLNERRREMSILRAVGARPGHIAALLVLEAALIGFGGALLGFVLVHAGLAGLSPLLADRWGIALIGTGPGLVDLSTILGITVAAAIMGTVPAVMAYRRALSDGLNVKV